MRFNVLLNFPREKLQNNLGHITHALSNGTRTILNRVLKKFLNVDFERLKKCILRGFFWFVIFDF